MSPISIRAISKRHEVLTPMEDHQQFDLNWYSHQEKQTSPPRGHSPEFHQFLRLHKLMQRHDAVTKLWEEVYLSCPQPFYNPSSKNNTNILILSLSHFVLLQKVYKMYIFTLLHFHSFIHVQPPCELCLCHQTLYTAISLIEAPGV